GRLRPGCASAGEARNEHQFAHHKAAASLSTPASISSGAANANESRRALETAPKRVPSHAVTPLARFSTSRPSGYPGSCSQTKNPTRKPDALVAQKDQL